MKQRFRNWIAVWNRLFPPFINEETTIRRLLFHYPHAQKWLLENHKIDRHTLQQQLGNSLQTFCTRFQLPPAQVLFLEIQMSAKWTGIEFVDACHAHALLLANPHTQILDVREQWERRVANILGSRHLDEELLSSLARSKDRQTPILLYCHFGVRSTDFAVRLKEWGYEKVWVLKGGIDAWATSVDSAMPRYEGSWC